MENGQRFLDLARNDKEHRALDLNFVSSRAAQTVSDPSQQINAEHLKICEIPHSMFGMTPFIARQGVSNSSTGHFSSAKRVG